MSKLFVLLCVCVCFTATHGMVRRDAPAAPNALAELEQHAAAFQKTFSEQLQTLAGSESSQQLTKALKEGSDAVMAQLSAFSASLQSALTDANGKAKEALQTAQGGLKAAADELRAQHPDVEQRAVALREQIGKAVQQAAAHSQALAKDVAASVDQTNQKLAPKIKEAYDDFVKQAQKVQEQLHQAATAKDKQ